MNITNKDKVKIIIAIVFLIISIALSVFAMRNWENSQLSGIAVLIAIVCAVIGWLLVRKYEFMQVAQVVGAFVGVLFAVVGHMVNGVKNLLGLNNDRYMRALHIKNYNDEEVSIGGMSALKKRKRPKFKKWKEMDDSEKIRYIYAKRNMKHIKKGYYYNETYTPNETLDEMIRKNIENKETGELFSNYYPARYTTNFKSDEDKINNLKKKFL